MESNRNARGSHDFYEAEVGNEKSQSLKEKIGASAEEIRKAIEKVGFDRAKVEEYLIQSRNVYRSSNN